MDEKPTEKTPEQIAALKRQVSGVPESVYDANTPEAREAVAKREEAAKKEAEKQKAANK